MKLEFLKCLSVMDRCLVLPHAVSRKKLHTALAAERKGNEEQMVNYTSSCSEKHKKKHPNVLNVTSIHSLIPFPSSCLVFKCISYLT